MASTTANATEALNARLDRILQAELKQEQAKVRRLEQQAINQALLQAQAIASPSPPGSPVSQLARSMPTFNRATTADSKKPKKKDEGPIPVRGLNRSNAGGVSYAKMAVNDRNNLVKLEDTFQKAFRPMSVPVDTIVSDLVSKREEVKQRYRQQQEDVVNQTGVSMSGPIITASSVNPDPRETSTRSHVHPADPLKGLNSQVVMSRVTGFIGQERSAQRRARREYVPCILKCLREERDLRGQFETHVEKLNHDRKEANRRSNSAFEIRRLKALGYSNAEIRSQSSCSEGNELQMGQPKNYLSWNRKLVSAGGEGKAEAKNRLEKRQHTSNHRREVYELHQEMLIHDAVHKELGAVQSSPDVGVNLAALQRWRVDTANRTRSSTPFAHSTGNRPDSRATTVVSTRPGTRGDIDHGRAGTPVRVDSPSKAHQRAVSPNRQTRRDVPHSEDLSAENAMALALQEAGDDPFDMEGLVSDLGEKRGSRFARDRRWLGILIMWKSAKLFEQARTKLPARGGRSVTALGASDPLGSDILPDPSHITGNLLTVSRMRSRPVFHPARPGAMDTLLTSLTRTKFRYFLHWQALRQRDRKASLLQHFLRYRFEQQKTTLYIRRYLRFCRLMVDKFIQSHHRQRCRLEGLTRQFDHFYYERMHYSRAVCGDAERKLQKTFTPGSPLKSPNAAAGAKEGGMIVPPMNPDKLQEEQSRQTSSAMTPQSTVKHSPNSRTNTTAGLASPTPTFGPKQVNAKSKVASGKSRAAHEALPVKQPIMTNEFALGRQIAIPFLATDAKIKKNGRLGSDPFSARIFAIATLGLLNQDKSPKLGPKTREFVIKFISERKRLRYIKQIQDWVEAMKEAVLKHEALCQLASITTSTPHAGAPSGGPKPSSLQRHLTNFEWPPKPYHHAMLQPNEVRLMVLTCYALGVQEKKWAFEATKGLDSTSNEHQQQLNAIHRHVCSEKNVLEVMRQQYETAVKDKVTGIRPWFLEDMHAFAPGSLGSSYPAAQEVKPSGGGPLGDKPSVG